MDKLVTTMLYYWALPAGKIGVGVLLFALGVIFLKVKEGEEIWGILLMLVGLGALFYGISTMDTKVHKEKPAPPPPPPVSKGFGEGPQIHIEMAKPSGS